MARLHLLTLLTGAWLMLPIRPLAAQTPGEGLPELSESKAVSLPDTAHGAVPLTVSAGTVGQVKALLPPELYALVHSGFIEFSASKSSDYAWELDADWKNFAAQAPARINAGPDPRAGVGWFYGTAAMVARERNAHARGERMLWNVLSVFWSMKILDAEWQLALVDRGRLTRVLGGELLRAYPRTLQATERAEQLFREVLRFTSPQPIAGLAWLTFRFTGADEDALWLYSVALGKNRQLTGSNRSDTLLAAEHAPDDFLVWSGKLDLVEAEHVATDCMLVPRVAALTGISIAASDPACETIAQGESGEGARGVAQVWGLEPSGTQPLQSAPPIVFPVGVRFVPSSVWRIELAPRDPFSRYGRQVLYIDAETMLPAYKVVYDRAGKLAKVVIGVFGLGAIPEQKRYLPYPLSEVAINPQTQHADILSYNSFKACSRFPEGLSLAQFDPTRLGPLTVESPAASPTPASKTGSASAVR